MAITSTFTDALDVDVGDPTKASDHDKLADNGEFVQQAADIDHDFDPSTGDGYHKCANDNPLHLKDDGGNILSLAVFRAGDGGIFLLLKDGAQSALARGDAEAWIELRPIDDSVPAS